jgi:hypothetical protein
MRFLLNTCFTLFFFQTLVVGQIELSGTVVDQQTQLPVEYANIGIFEKGIGTVTNMKGEFSFILPENLKTEPIMVSHLGYGDTSFYFNQLLSKKNIIIELAMVANDLKGITFLGGETVNLGYLPADDQAKGYFKANGLGMEGGTLIRNKDTVVLTRFNLNILDLPYDSIKFRLNIYAMIKNKPGPKVNKKDILFTLRKEHIGKFSLSIAQENLVVVNDFLCTLELIELFGREMENARFTFSAIPDKNGLIFKKGISMGKWEKIKNYSLCFWLSAKK